MPYTSNYTPKGAALIAGIGTTLGDAITKQKEEARKFKTLQEYAEVMGYAPKDQTTPWDLGRLEGFIKGNEGKRLQQEQLLKEQQQALQMQVLAQQMNGLNRAQAGDDAFQRALQAAGTAAPEMIAAPGAPHAGMSFQDRLLQSVAQNPQAAMSPRMGELLRSFAMVGGGDNFKFNPKEMVVDLGDGTKFVQTSRGGGQLERAPESLITEKPDYEPGPGMRFSQRGKYWYEVEDPTQWETVTEGGAFPGEARTTRKRFVGKGGKPAEAPAADGQANVTQEEYAKLKKGDTYWWNGKQLTKQ